MQPGALEIDRLLQDALESNLADFLLRVFVLYIHLQLGHRPCSGLWFATPHPRLS